MYYYYLLYNLQVTFVYMNNKCYYCINLTCKQFLIWTPYFQKAPTLCLLTMHVQRDCTTIAGVLYRTCCSHQVSPLGPAIHNQRHRSKPWPAELVLDLEWTGSQTSHSRRLSICGQCLDFTRLLWKHLPLKGCPIESTRFRNPPAVEIVSSLCLDTIAMALGFLNHINSRNHDRTIIYIHHSNGPRVSK